METVVSKSTTLDIATVETIVKWSYSLAKKYVTTYLVPKGVNSARKFEKYKREGGHLPKKFPRIPDEYFKRKGSWVSWNDFFGYPSHTKHYLTYRDACKLVRAHKIHNSQAYKTWENRPENIPARPEYHYTEWRGWDKFLGEHYRPADHRNFCKLSVGDVRIIKHQLAMGVPGATLARQFKVSEMQISRIRNGENWNDI